MGGMGDQKGGGGGERKGLYPDTEIPSLFDGFDSYVLNGRERRWVQWKCSA